ncbi:MAG: hypothetical protein ACI9AT_001254 [Ulvibacter sp.]|jgi:hypothetical protein
MKNTCAYCGCLGETTIDHVPPRCLFRRPHPVDMITVPACNSCHRNISIDDEYFMMALGLVLCENENEHSIFLTNKVKRALKRPEARKLKKSFQKRLKKVAIHSDAGIYLGDTTAIQFDWSRLKLFATRVLVGLHYNEFSKPVPEGYEKNVFLTWFQKDTEIFGSPDIKELINILACSNKVNVGNNTLQYWLSIAEDDDSSSFWYIRLAEEFGFFGLISPEES